VIVTEEGVFVCKAGVKAGFSHDKRNGPALVTGGRAGRPGLRREDGATAGAQPERQFSADDWAEGKQTFCFPLLVFIASQRPEKRKTHLFVSFYKN
jgi:hypothetical protein